MRPSRSSWLVVLLLLLAGSTARGAAVRLAIVPDAATAGTADVLAAELSGAGVELVERAEVDRVRREQALSASNPLGGQVQLAGLLRADGLLALERITLEGKPVLAARLIAAGPGVVLGAMEVAFPEPEDPAALARALATRVRPLLPKLSLPTGGAVPVSLLNLRVPLGTAAGQRLERELTFLLGRQLIRQERLVVLERWRLGEANAEREMAPSAAAVNGEEPFWRGAVIVDGEVEPAAGGAPGAFKVRVFLRPPAGGIPVQTLEAAGTEADLAAVALDLAGRVAGRLDARSGAAAPAPWEPAAEGAQFAQEAGWAFRAGLPEVARGAAETALTLGDRSPGFMRLRVLLHATLAYPTDPRDTPYPHGYAPRRIVPLRDPAHLRDARLALEAWEAWIARPESRQPPERPRDDDPGALANHVLIAASRVLRATVEQRTGPTAEDGELAGELSDLRAAVRRVAARAEALAQTEPNHFADWRQGMIIAVYRPFWTERPAETLAVCRQELHGPRGPVRFNRRGILARRGRPPPPGTAGDEYATPWLVGWHGESAAELRALWERFLVGLENSPAPAPTDAPDAALLRLAGGGRTDVAGQLLRLKRFQEALWAAREPVLAGDLVGDYLEATQDFLNDNVRGERLDERLATTPAERWRWLEFFLERASHDDYTALHLLWRPEEWTEAQAAQTFLAWTAFKVRLDARPGGWREKPASYAIMESQLVGRFPGVAHTAAAGATVTPRFWPLPAPPGASARGGWFDGAEVRHVEGENRLWVCVSFAGGGTLLGLELPTGRVIEELPLPEGVALGSHVGSVQSHHYGLRFQADARAFYLLGLKCVFRYDRRTAGPWQRVDLPEGLSGTTLQPMPEDGGFLISYAFTGSGILRWRPSDAANIGHGPGEWETLTSSRRRPRRNSLDDRPEYQVQELYPGPGETLGASVDLRGWYYDPKKGDWTEPLPGRSSAAWQTKNSARTLLFWRGFLVRLENGEHPRAVHWLWNEPFRADVKQQTDRLAGDPAGAAYQKADLEQMVAYDPTRERLLVTTPRCLSPGRQQTLRAYDWKDESAPSPSAGLDFTLSPETKAKLDAARRVVQPGSEDPASHLRLAVTPHGVAFWDFGLPGIWFLPAAELDAALAGK